MGSYIYIAIIAIAMVEVDHGVMDPMVDLDHVEVVEVGPQWGRFQHSPITLQFTII
jgi:hypothetical protein